MDVPYTRNCRKIRISLGREIADHDLEVVFNHSPGTLSLTETTKGLGIDD